VSPGAFSFFRARMVDPTNGLYQSVTFSRPAMYTKVVGCALFNTFSGVPNARFEQRRNG
jgi:hypothetical protein